MKKYIFTLFLLVATTGISVRVHGQTPDYLGLPGDNLNLFAVMKLFQESQTLEIFERDLNNEDMHINNLDLDQDGRIDYIRVIDNVDGDFHTIVLQDALSPRDIQDVAVFTVHRDRQRRVSIQLTGDEALYGRDYIVEPNYADLEYSETPNPGYTYYNNVNGETVVVNRTTTVEIAMWPLIRFMFLPTYVVWHSPWYYNYYPSYWRPWRPYYWHYYYGYHYNWDHYYYGHYRVYHYHRHPYWHDTYYSQRRSYSPVVTTRVQSGSYRKTYSHPEARKAGYDMYYKKHPDQIARRSSSTIADPVARKSTAQRSSTTTGERRTMGESRSSNQVNKAIQTNTRTRTTETVQPKTRSRSTGTSTDTRVSNTNQKPRTLGNRSQTQTQTQTQTRTLNQSRSTEKSGGTQVRGTEQKSGNGRSQTTTRTYQNSDNSGNRGSQHRTETSRSGSSERKSSDANTSGASRKPAEKKDAGSATTAEKRGGERRTAN
jgi:hypothetical protein